MHQLYIQKGLSDRVVRALQERLQLFLGMSSMPSSGLEEAHAEGRGRSRSRAMVESRAEGTGCGGTGEADAPASGGGAGVPAGTGEVEMSPGVFHHLPLLRLQCQSLVFHRVQVEWQLSSLSMWIRIPRSIRYSMPRTSWP